VVGLDPGCETVETSRVRHGVQIDVVTHDVKKFLSLLLKRNGYVLEQLYSPLVVHSTPLHDELKKVARGCITRRHAHHYLGFARTQWGLFEKERPRRVKPLLYTYRVLLTGIHLMRSGEVEANLVRLNEDFKLPYIAELIALKVLGSETSVVDEADLGSHSEEYERLYRELERAAETSELPDTPTARPALNDLLIHTRLVSFPEG
jgi:predicted nucleotidyltransferase